MPVSQGLRNPPRVTFSWGSLQFVGHISSLTINYKQFGIAGQPIRAEVNIQMMENPEAVPGTNPTSGGIAGRRVHVVSAGDTLHSVSYTEYGSPGIVAGARGGERHRRSPARLSRDNTAHPARPPFGGRPMTADVLVSWPAVEIDGTTLSDDLRVGLTGVVVDNHIHLPDMFTMVFDDPLHNLISEASVKVGSTVTIKATTVGSTTPDLLIGGEVTALEASYEGGWDRTIVRGYDKSHRLHRGRRTETYQNVKVSDVAQTVASRAGLDVGTIDDSGAVLDFISQVNISDWDFLKARARELGFEVGVVDGQFFFRKPVQSTTGPDPGDADSQGPAQLVYGRDLVSLPAAGELVGAGDADQRPRLGSRHQGGARRLGRSGVGACDAAR